MNAGFPEIVYVEDSAVTTGIGLTTENIWPEDVPPAGAGLETVSVDVPTELRSLAGIRAVSVVLLTKVVVMADPFHWMTELATKFDPVAVSVNAGLPTMVELGERVIKTGAG